ncbi:hypothetical protein SDC9_125731 [bioreactor metagenome]|uniref:Uncharacterized protein n=1 Tax=bioreactor metagenome TaxID=1076179 RepID=A0A645CNT7_9ZZZZ
MGDKDEKDYKEGKHYNRRIKQAKNGEDDEKLKGTLTMNELGKEVFPELDEITSTRKASKIFRDVCKKAKLDPEMYKSERDYVIPKGSLPFWRVILRNYNYEDKDKGKGKEKAPSKNKSMKFIKELIEAKEEVDNNLTYENLYNASFQNAINAIYEMFYNATSNTREAISALYFDKALQKMKEDLKYILDKAPDDGKVFYSEYYYSGVMSKIQIMSKQVRNMIDKDLNKKRMSDIKDQEV